MATQVIKYIAPTTHLVGKTIWEIVGNLKDYGIGRIIVRNDHLKKYDTPCYFRIQEIQTHQFLPPVQKPRFRWPNDHRLETRLRRVTAVCERVFKGVKYENPIFITKESELTDYLLVPKHEEHKYKPHTTELEVIENNLLPRHIDYPPMLRRLQMEKGVHNPKLAVYIEECPYDPNLYRIAKEDEKPTIEVPQGFGKAINSDFVKGVDYNV